MTTGTEPQTPTTPPLGPAAPTRAEVAEARAHAVATDRALGEWLSSDVDADKPNLPAARAEAAAALKAWKHQLTPTEASSEDHEPGAPIYADRTQLTSAMHRQARAEIDEAVSRLAAHGPAPESVPARRAAALDAMVLRSKDGKIIARPVGHTTLDLTRWAACEMATLLEAAWLAVAAPLSAEELDALSPNYCALPLGNDAVLLF